MHGGVELMCDEQRNGCPETGGFADDETPAVAKVIKDRPPAITSRC